ncbi:MAG: hypothetical protein EOS41_29845 [Mesorhizobium sp.]|nr:hypothetical protein [Mesorhizobium sp.]RWE19782.1 MAG: hypothetical protein EOS41_29845 [Mesorhizobium sp.]
MEALADSRHTYVVSEAYGTPLGFAKLRAPASPEHATLVERLLHSFKAVSAFGTIQTNFGDTVVDFAGNRSNIMPFLRPH